jgi:hypothetical protein
MSEANEAKLHEDAQKGHNAAFAMETLGSVLEELEDSFIKAWRDTPARDQDARERYWQAVQIVGKVGTVLKKRVSDGKIAERQIALIARAAEEKRKRKAART